MALNDDLKKLGLRVRKRIEAAAAPGAKIRAEELNNRLSDDDDTGERLTDPLLDHALSYEGLAIVDEDPVPTSTAQVNKKGLRVGYNPYESGLLPKTGRKPKRDLNQLSRWIETKRKLEDKKP